MLKEFCRIALSLAIAMTSTEAYSQRVDFGVIEPSPELGKPGELKAVSAIRLTTPGAAEYAFGLRELFSSDMRRILYHHGGRTVWSYVSKLKTWKTSAEFNAIRNELPTSFATFVEWSPFKGEENIVYAADLRSPPQGHRKISTAKTCAKSRAHAILRRLRYGGSRSGSPFEFEVPTATAGEFTAGCAPPGP